MWEIAEGLPAGGELHRGGMDVSSTAHKADRDGAVGHPGRRSGRRPGSLTARDDILVAGRKMFAKSGYHGATTRAVAQEANVDAALIHHFFGPKDDFFAAAIQGAVHPEDILSEVFGPGTGPLGERLAYSFLQRWESPGSREAMIALIRSALSYDQAFDLLTDLVTRRIVGEIVRTVCTSDVDVRVNVVSAQLIGLALVRYVIKVEPLASADLETVAEYVGPILGRFLSDDLDVVALPDLQQLRTAVT